MVSFEQKFLLKSRVWGQPSCNLDQNRQTLHIPLISPRTDLVFGIVGSAFMDALDIFEPAGIRFVSVQHEQNAVHMADGYARALNDPSVAGVCIAQNGPGITNFVTGNIKFQSISHCHYI